MMLRNIVRGKPLRQFRGIEKTFEITRRISGDHRRRSTIYALSSGYGKCGVAVIRISGPEALIALKKMTRITKLEARKAYLRKIRDPETKEVLDKGLCLWFPGPASFTGEDSAEFHVHGGPAVIKSLLSALSKLHFSPAAPGEFTKRSFFNGKLDLTEAEGIGDLIEAETEKQRRQATCQTSGNLRKLYDSWRYSLLSCLSNLEAYVDFSEENQITDDLVEETRESLRKLYREIESHLTDGRKGEILRQGIHMTILGPTNVGKSSLTNLLTRQETSIVTEIPGTTRDLVRTKIEVSGYSVILMDTAGIRNDPENSVEIEGIRRAKQSAKNADFILSMIDGTKFDGSFENYKKSLGIEDHNHRRILFIINKIDMLDPQERMKWRGEKIDFAEISCKTEEGIDDLIKKMTVICEELCGDPTEENPVISHERYRHHLTRTLEHIQNYLNTSKSEEHDAAISLEEIRAAGRELGKITGRIGSEEILDVIFKKFCVGK